VGVGGSVSVPLGKIGGDQNPPKKEEPPLDTEGASKRP
jgi:hypothetical protein